VDKQKQNLGHQTSLISGTNQATDKGLLLEQSILLEQMHSYSIMPHEFLYLVCNASNRLTQIKKNHKIDMKSEKYALTTQF